MRNSLGIKNPQKMTIDVTPKAVAARQAAIVAEEAKLAAENQAMTTAVSEVFVDEAGTSEQLQPAKKLSKAKKEA